MCANVLANVGGCTWRGDLQVGGLLDVGSSWSGIEGGDQSRKLPLQDKVVIPRPPAASFGLILFLLLWDSGSHTLITPSDITSCYSLLMLPNQKFYYQDLLILLVLLIVVFVLVVVVVGLREVLLVVQLGQ